jgi:signal transduction histidine kinase
VFLAAVVCLAVWQIWLTWRVMEQDRNLAAGRARDRLEQIADLALAHLRATLADWDLSLHETEALPPTDALKSRLPPNGAFILLTPPAAITTYPFRPLLFAASPPAAGPALDRAFDTPDRLEFREQKYDQAIAALRSLVEHPASRAEALLRIARLERRLGNAGRAIATYDRMSGETAVSPDGVPYALIAAGARCEMLPESCADLRATLLAGRWPMRRETFEYYWGAKDVPPKQDFDFAMRVSWLYQQWRQDVSSSGGRRVEPDGSLLLWQITQAHLTALSVPSGWLDGALKLPANATDIRWRTDSAGTGLSVRRSLAEAQLGGPIEFYSVASAPDAGPNRALWLAGTALMLLLVLGGAYAMHRGVSRELHVGRLQSDFVSAVSHEFRTPLTSLRGIAELLAKDRLTDESRRRQSYVFLERETGRLQRLVEDLLDFGRMESGWKQYRMEPHDAFGLARAAIAEFRDEAAQTGFELDVQMEDRAAPIRADEEALRRAIRNLLENAVKYSPECRTVWVVGHVNHRQVAISVRDRGIGIVAHEQREIFRKFVRGNAAKKAGIKGTGIGLSMVRQIVEACGGEVRLESSEGIGSTFTILMPLEKQT